MRPGVAAPRVGRNGGVLNGFKNPNDPKYDMYTSTHAEYSLVKNHSKNCPALKHILVVRFYPKKMNLGISRPCYICQTVLLDYGVERVTYSSYNGEFVTELVAEMDANSSESD